MAVLKCDQTGERFYETGTKQAVLYKLDAQGAYTDAHAWSGITAFTASPSGAESNPLWADDIKYLDLRSREEFGATIEAYTYPDAWAECDGSATIEGAPGLYIGQQSRKPFGFSIKTTVGNDVDYNDKGYKLHLIYNATASPSEKSYATINDSPEAVTFSWEVTTTPIPVDPEDSNSAYTAYLCIDSTKATKANLEALEAKLYGTVSESAYLPLPGEVIEILGGSTGGATGATGATGAVGQG